MKYLSLITLLMLGCGSDRGEPTDPRPATDKLNSQSIALDSIDDLPRCTKTVKHQLAYIIDEKSFYTCDGETWQLIDDVPQAVTVLKGKDGADGVNGQTVSVNNWADPVTGTLWFIGSNVTYPNAQLACGDRMRLPTKDELLLAVQRGLGLASLDISGPSTGWTTEVWSLNATHNVTITSMHTTVAESVAVRATDTRGVFCVEE